MRFLLIIVLFLIPLKTFSQINIVYLDVQFIIDNSDIGKFYKTKMEKISNKNNNELNSDKTIIKNKETELNNQKNILSENEIKNKVDELNKLINSYQLKRSNLKKEFLKQKNEYSSKILQILNPILTEYAKNNNITLVLEKKNILLGEKSSDITNQILDKVNQQTKENNLLNEN